MPTKYLLDVDAQTASVLSVGQIVHLEWSEEDHPRDEKGQFGGGGGSSISNVEENPAAGRSRSWIATQNGEKVILKSKAGAAREIAAKEVADKLGFVKVPASEVKETPVGEKLVKEWVEGSSPNNSLAARDTPIEARVFAQVVSHPDMSNPNIVVDGKGNINSIDNAEAFSSNPEAGLDPHGDSVPLSIVSALSNFRDAIPGLALKGISAAARDRMQTRVDFIVNNGRLASTRDSVHLEWNEEDHPRDAGGKFGEGDGGGGKPEGIKGIDDFPKSIQSALLSYRGDTGEGIDVSGYLRGEKLDDQEKSQAIAQVNKLDKAFDMATPLTEPLTVYRGVPADIAERFDNGRYFEQGYSSVSLSPRTAGLFGDRVVEIHLPAGTSAIWMQQGSSLGDRELLLPRSKYYGLTLSNKGTFVVMLAASDSKAHALIATTASALAALAQQLADGEITEKEFENQAVGVLGASYSDAFAIEGDEEDDDWSDGAADAQRSYLAGFAGAVAAGAAFWPGGSKEGQTPNVADAVLSPEGASARADLYAGQVWTGYQRGIVTSMPGEYEWEAEDDKGTCDDCDGLNGQSWTIDEIPQWPGDGNTQCLGNCRCKLKRVTAADAAEEAA